MAIAVSLVMAAAWLAAGVVIYLRYPDWPDSWLVAGVAFLMGVFNLVKAWAQHRARQRRDASRGASQQQYRAGEPPPVRRAP